MRQNLQSLLYHYYTECFLQLWSFPFSFHLFLKLLRIHNCTGYWKFLMLFKFNYLRSFAKWELILAFMLLVQSWIFLYFSSLQSGWRKVKRNRNIRNKEKNKIYMNPVEFASKCIHLFFLSHFNFIHHLMQCCTFSL